MPALAGRGLELLEPIHAFPLSLVEDGAGKGRRIVVIRKDLASSAESLSLSLEAHREKAPDAMTEQDQPIKIYRGLKDVYFERSGTSSIDGKAGELRYRGYSIHDLAVHSSFEETAFLLLHGELPDRAALERFEAELKEARALPPAVLEIIERIKTAHPMDVLRTCVSALSAFDPESADKSREANVRKGVRLTAQAPMIVCAHHHIRKGQAPLPPDAGLGHAANFLWMLKGERPSPESARLMDTDFVLHAEHGSNASSFAARVVIGTDADLHAAVTAAVAALSGPAHGGAAEDVMKMAIEIGEPEKAAGLCGAKAPQQGGRDRLRPSRLSHRGSARAPHAGRRRAALEGDGPAEMVRHPAGGGRGAWRPMRAMAST